MLNFEPNNWYVYIINNNHTNWLYVGLHNQQTKSYTHSSGSVILQDAIDKGETSDYIVWKGTNKEKAHALETYLINLAKNNGYNVYNNNSGGGHKGGARQNILTPEDYNVGENIILHKVFPKSIDTDDEVEVNDRLQNLAREVRDLVEDTIIGNNSTAHKVVYEPIGKIIDLPFLQIRINAVDRDNVDRVIESMEMDIKKAERLVEAVSIVRFKSGRLLRVDGTTTVYAIKELNKWKTVPVVYLDSELFNDNETYMEVYATLRNRPEKHKGANDPKKELKGRIRNFHNANPDLFQRSPEDFAKKFMALFKGSYSERSMQSNLNIYIKDINDRNSRGENWLDYGVNSGELLDWLERKIRLMFDRSECTRISVGSLEREGVANPMNYFGNGISGKTTSIQLAYHTTPATEDRETYHFDRMSNSLAEAGYFLDNTKQMYGYTPFVSKITEKKIFVLFLPCRVDTRKRIDENLILSKLFDEEHLIAA
jgi:predicted GIY-YIG superfamily endonuclease